MNLIDEAIQQLRQSSASMRCSDMRRLLESLGFEVSKASSGNHQLVDHNGIPNFPGSNYDCGHGKNQQIKPGYTKKMRTLIEKYRSELSTHLGIKND